MVRQGDLPHDELLSRVAGKQGLLSVVTDTIDRPVFESGQELKVVSTIAVGYNNIDVAAAREHGVVVTNTPDVLTETAADLTWSLILSMTRRIVEGDRLTRRGAWKGFALDFMLGTDLRDKQLGIVGFGRIGKAVAARAAAFGMRVAFSSRTGGLVAPRRGDAARSAAVDLGCRHTALPAQGRNAASHQPDDAGEDEAERLPGQRVTRAGGGRGGARVGARKPSHCGRGARRLRARARDSQRAARRSKTWCFRPTSAAPRSKREPR